MYLLMVSVIIFALLYNFIFKRLRPIFSQDQLSHKQNFFPDQGIFLQAKIFPQVKIFPWSKKFSTRKFFSKKKIFYEPGSFPRAKSLFTPIQCLKYYAELCWPFKAWWQEKIIRVSISSKLLIVGLFKYIWPLVATRY